MKEVRNHLQELAKENTMVIEETDSIISHEREEQTHRRKIIDKFIKHKAPGIDGIITELIHKAGPTL
jgi:hypothetical protein